MKKYWKYLIGMVLLLAAVVLIWYHIPGKVQKTVNVCTEDGTMAEVTFDIKKQRHLFGETEWIGNITINGVDYENVSGTSSMFARSGVNGPDIHSNCVFVGMKKGDFEVFSLLVRDKEKQTVYYGEAKNAEDVASVMAQLSESK